MHADGWGSCVILRLDLPRFPDRWDGGPGDTLQCQIGFSHVEDFVMEGWRPPVTADIGLTPLPRNRLAVHVTAPGTEVSFTTVASLTLGKVGVFTQDADGGDGGPPSASYPCTTGCTRRCPRPTSTSSTRGPEMSLAPWPELAALYDTPPELSSCPLYDVHVDERDTSVTLGLQTAQLPDHPEPEWARSTYNTLCFFLVFTGVEDLRMTGIASEHPDRHDRTVRVTVGPRWGRAVVGFGDQREPHHRLLGRRLRRHRHPRVPPGTRVSALRAPGR